MSVLLAIAAFVAKLTLGLASIVVAAVLILVALESALALAIRALSAFASWRYRKK